MEFRYLCGLMKSMIKSLAGEYETFRDKETQEKIVENGQIALPQLFLWYRKA